MATPILTTKLYIPPLRPKIVLRPHLIERLNAGLHAGCKLTLISAPAGFGKTTLVSHWIAEHRRQVAWLSLDEGDNHLVRFLADLVAALQTIAPEIGRGVPGLLQSPQAPVEAILTALLNDLAAVPHDFILVLDDYHLIEARPPDDALVFLLEHLPLQMHLVVATREDPHLPLARLRARGQLTELRAADLRFTRSEAAGFLNQVMGLSLSGDDIALLEERTEGWIAGLKLAALALQGTRALQGTHSTQGRQDVSGFIQAFAGDHRYILDFLVEEVLQRQPAPIRSFLLQTSILDRLTGPLCEAVTGQESGQARLEALERGNYFIVPLTERRQWYRYHHLFAQVLSVHLAAEQPDLLPVLHRRASDWYAQNGLLADAVQHALAAAELGQAAELVERAMPDLRRSRQEATLLQWLQALPREEIRRRPVLGVGYAHVLLAHGRLEGVAELLLDAEEALEDPEAANDVRTVVDEEAFRRLPGEIAIARAGMALARGDVPATMNYARRALDQAPEDDHFTRGGAAGFLGLANWTNGDLEAAHRTYAQGMASLEAAGNIADAVNGSITLATIRIAQGRLRQAMRTYERGLQLAAEQDGVVVRGVADMHVGMSEILREWDDLDAARERLLRSREMGPHMRFPQNRYRWRVAMACVLEAEGDLEGALTLLDEAERLYMPDFTPNVRPIAALRARVWLPQGRLGDALDWAREQDLSAEDDLSYLNEFEHITLARLLLARHRYDQAVTALPEANGLLERLLQASEEGQRMGSLIEILTLQALVHQAQGDSPRALAPLERALTLAEPEGYVRMFVDEGQPMALLLQEATKHRIAPSYVRRLLTAFGKAEDRPPVNQQLLEPLSERELEVLLLLATDLNGPEIARELTVSLPTIRTHTRNIFSKLGVNNRRAAVRRAEELALL